MLFLLLLFIKDLNNGQEKLIIPLTLFWSYLSNVWISYFLSRCSGLTFSMFEGVISFHAVLVLPLFNVWISYFLSRCSGLSMSYFLSRCSRLNSLQYLDELFPLTPFRSEPSSTPIIDFLSRLSGLNPLQHQSFISSYAFPVLTLFSI